MRSRQTGLRAAIIVASSFAAACGSGELEGAIGQASTSRVQREIAFVIEAGSWAAEDCAPEDFDGAFPSGWGCEGSPHEPTDWHGWEEQKRGLSGALLALDVDDTPV